MEQESLTSEQAAEVETLTAEFVRHVQRVSIDLEAASARLREIAPRRREATSGAEFEVTLAINVSGVIETLRTLPDGAGTDAFVEAYSARQ